NLDCGCIPLEYQKSHNFLLIRKVLYANKANGRRKNIRAICGAGSYIHFIYKSEIYKAQIRDVSMTHFSCVYTQKPFDIPLHEKIHDIRMNIKGQRLSVNAVQTMERKIGNDFLYVFIFRTDADNDGLNSDMHVRMQSIVYSITKKNTYELLDRLFLAIRDRLKKQKKSK
ncbi:MAG TPA: hypothetical protein VFC68_04245, partial [Treponemataceae bacterium]|nr:hypothetical protein [Treponemataceae bacterium]